MNRKFEWSPGKAVLLALALGGMLWLTGCGTAMINKPELAKVKTAAVVVFTVPTQIEYWEDPRDHTRSLLAAIIEAAASGDGAQAATVSYGTFTEALNQQGLPFKVLSQANVKSSAAFKTLVAEIQSGQDMMEAKEDDDSLISITFITGDPRVVDGSAPDGMVEFGLVSEKHWGDADPLAGTEEERAFIIKSIAALGVDAAIVVADPGFAFACEACIGGTGAGTTGSAFMIGMFNRQGAPILAMRQWFATTDEQAAMAVYIVNPLEHEDLYAEHGRKMASEFAIQFKETMAE